ncbi:MAG: hypothetical protein KL863_23610 [Rhizobium sp.]|nr:hypothetical protein [Rhizobium sp.]
MTGDGDAKTSTVEDMSRMMIGDTEVKERRRSRGHDGEEGRARISPACFAEDEIGLPAIHAINLKVRSGEIVRHRRGVGQRPVGAGSRRSRARGSCRRGRSSSNGQDFTPTRGNFRALQGVRTAGRAAEECRRAADEP